MEQAQRRGKQRVTAARGGEAGCGGCVSMMWSERKGIAGVVRCPPTAALSAVRRLLFLRFRAAAMTMRFA